MTGRPGGDMHEAEQIARPLSGELGGYFQRGDDFGDLFGIRWGKIEFEISHGVSANLKVILRVYRQDVCETYIVDTDAFDVQWNRHRRRTRDFYVLPYSPRLGPTSCVKFSFVVHLGERSIVSGGEYIFMDRRQVHDGARQFREITGQYATANPYRTFELDAGELQRHVDWYIRLNHRHKLTGHVLSGRYQAQLVEGSGKGYLRAVCDDVHLNPVRAGLLAAKERLLAYPWSSFGLYLAAREHRPAWMRVDRLLGEHGLQRDTPGSRREFERHLERRRREEVDPEAQEALRRDWCLGSEAFRKEQLERMEGGLGQHHAGQLRLETAQAKAERLVAEELRRLGWSAEDLVRRPKNDPAKLAIAVRLRRETTLTIKAIAARVHLGTYNTANARLHQAMKERRARLTVRK